MRKLRPILLPLLALCLGVGLEVALFCVWSTRPSTPDGPATLHEVAELAERMGLYCRSDNIDGVVRNRLLVSRSPLTHLAANQVVFGAPRKRCWQGVVAVCRPWRGYVSNFDPGYSAVWGNLFLYGDPDVIRRLTGRPWDVNPSRARSEAE
jgi:hypothetical protein